MKQGLYLWVAAVCFGLSACSSTVNERHYFAQYDAETDKPVNFYRMTISGSSEMSRSRYISGYYDERAVDLFFNEIKTLPEAQAAERENIPALFSNTQTNPGTSDKLVPLNPNSGNGAFVLVMSNNADSVVNAIGSFSESQVVAQTLTALLNKDQFREQIRDTATAEVERSNASALKANLTSLLAAAKAAGNADAERLYLQALNALARDLGHDESFEDFDKARAWFALEREVSANAG